jgi:hypothetical protein
MRARPTADAEHHWRFFAWLSSILHQKRFFRLIKATTQFMISPSETIVTANGLFLIGDLGLAQVHTMIDKRKHFPVLVKDDKFRSLLSGIEDMNETGRNYIQRDSTNRLQGVRVLEAGIGNPDCLYLHLRESPGLFPVTTGNRNSVAVARPSQLRHHVAADMTTDDDPRGS